MLIKKLNVNYNGMQVMSQDNINHCVNVKVMNEFNSIYENTIGRAFFNYPDTNSLTVRDGAG